MIEFMAPGAGSKARRSAEPGRATALRAAHSRRAAQGVLLACVLALLAGCVYRLPIRQGNYLDPAAIAQVKPGMTHSQVRYLLGTPMVPESFDNGRWDYDYYLNDHSHKPRHAHVTIYFDHDLVARVQSNVKRAPVTAVTRGGVPVPNTF
jgi:outer membrane protein assembly factor BamE